MNRGRRPYRRGNYDNQTVSNILEQIVGAISNMGDRQQGESAQRGCFRGRGRGSRPPSHRRQAANPEENSYPRQRREGGSRGRGTRHTVTAEAAPDVEADPEVEVSGPAWRQRKQQL